MRRKKNKKYAKVILNIIIYMILFFLLIYSGAKIFKWYKDKTNNTQIAEQIKNTVIFEEEKENEDEEENKRFNKVAFIKYTYGKDPKPIDAVVLTFNFDNQEFKIGNKTYKVKKDDKYTFKFLKRTLKCNGGLEGFYKFIVREMYDQLFSSLVYTLKKAGELVEEV